MWATQLGLFGDGVAVGHVPAPARRVYDHETIMRERAEAIKDICATRADFHEMWAAELTLEERIAEDRSNQPWQLAALFWQNVWERLQGRSDCWCVMCPSDLSETCPVRAVIYDEARRVNAPHREP